MVATISSLPQPVNRRPLLGTAATLGALGVVYGDIGTSPLYALKQAVKSASIEHAGLRCGTPEHISYYIGRETIIPTASIRWMWVWRKVVYAFMQRNAERSAAYFGIPAAQVVEIGTEIEI
jgi:K+ transporter